MKSSELKKCKKKLFLLLLTNMFNQNVSIRSIKIKFLFTSFLSVDFSSIFTSFYILFLMRFEEWTKKHKKSIYFSILFRRSALRCHIEYYVNKEVGLMIRFRICCNNYWGFSKWDLHSSNNSKWLRFSSLSRFFLFSFSLWH